MKSLSELYNDAHVALGRKQHAKYGNPITTAPDHVPGVLRCALDAGHLTNEQARKLATQLGRKAYGEVGLTPGVVSMVLDKVLGFNAPGMPWHVKGRLEADLSRY